MYRNFYEIFSELRIFFQNQGAHKQGKMLFCRVESGSESHSEEDEVHKHLPVCRHLRRLLQPVSPVQLVLPEVDDQSLEDTTVNFVKSILVNFQKIRVQKATS